MKFKKVESGIYKAEGKNIWIAKCKRHGDWNAYRSEPTGWSAFDSMDDFIDNAATKREIVAKVS